jgi:hypothetical protein
MADLIRKLPITGSTFYNKKFHLSEKIINKINEISAKHQIKQKDIVYDSDGIGGLLRGFFRQAHPFTAISPPLKVLGKQENFVNIRAQCGFKLAEMFRKKQIYFGGNTHKYKEDIIKELEQLKYEEVGDKKLKLISKDKVRDAIKYSPDILDMLIMRCIFEMQNKVKQFSNSLWG